MRKHALFIVCLWLAPLLLSGFAGRALAQEKEGIICADCHEERTASFLHSFHARMWKGEGRSLANPCENCHGPTDRHLENPSRETIISFGPQSAQTPQEQSAQCLHCHDSFEELAMWAMGPHKRNEVSCVSCHSVHVANPAPDQPEVCFNCHKGKKMQSYKTSHHPVIEKKILCSNCHNPHGTLSPGLIRADNVNQLCYQCHPEKRGPWLWEHPPVEENCEYCHNPHGSRHENLLKEKIPNLCQDCHDFSRHPGTAYDNTNGFLGPNPTNRFFARSCLNCHGRIHGSKSPDNPSNGSNSGQFWIR